MKKRFLYTILLISVSVVFYYINFYLDQNLLKGKSIPTSVFEEFLPSSTSGVVISRQHYSFSYREDHEQAEWVMYALSKDMISKNQYDRPYFEKDPYVLTESADWRNYKNSGYERGHLCPAGDMKFNYDAFRDTFYTSNIAPQSSRFNGGIWNSLEQKIRSLAKKKKELIIVTGGVLSDNLQTIGYEGVSVPKFYYKILLSLNKDYEAIAFLIPQDYKSNDLKSYVTTIDKIEEYTGIDFFENLNKQKQKELESGITLRNWNLD